MPIYEYLCQDCSFRFELKQSMKDDPVAACSKCGKSVSRIISAPAIMFKGSGWYVTDYSDKMKPPSDSTSGTKKEPATTPEKATPASPAPATTTSSAATPAATPTTTGSTSSGSTSSSGTSSSST
ncbi:MAG: zinc ribbon domain-containing protein [Nitrospira sp.]|nr:zinc ribbon domain-containing protein [Nitrospira sp.]MBH0182657.1 zinc ribbon domain-containing protein [Nitrospira sp.]MBH0184769.1 zinc ribbon domain-containing protein [Nitrospira sp.]MBH0194326.1 zinc ribbon domain-containing protein [Nitrospira sp.]